MYCTNCGKQHNTCDKFCTNCGTKTNIQYKKINSEVKQEFSKKLKLFIIISGILEVIEAIPYFEVFITIYDDVWVSGLLTMLTPLFLIFAIGLLILAFFNIKSIKKQNISMLQTISIIELSYSLFLFNILNLPILIISIIKLITLSKIK